MSWRRPLKPMRGSGPPSAHIWRRRLPAAPGSFAIWMRKASRRAQSPMSTRRDFPLIRMKRRATGGRYRSAHCRCQVSIGSVRSIPRGQSSFDDGNDDQGCNGLCACLDLQRSLESRNEETRCLLWKSSAPFGCCRSRHCCGAVNMRGLLQSMCGALCQQPQRGNEGKVHSRPLLAQAFDLPPYRLLD